MRRAALALVALHACAPSTEGHFIEPEGAESLLVLRTVDGQTEAIALDLGPAPTPVWFPAAAEDVQVVRYRCGLAALGLAAGPIAVGDEGRPLPRSSFGEVPEVRLPSELPACRPLAMRSLALPAPVRWLSSDGRAVLVGHPEAVTWVDPDGSILTQPAPPSLYGLGLADRTTLFFEGGGTQALTRQGPHGPRVQLEAGLWDRWLSGRASTEAAWLVTDRGAVLELREAMVAVQSRLPMTTIEPTAMLALDGDRVWLGGPSLSQVLRLDAPDTRLPALVGRVQSLSVVQSTLHVATERGAVSAWRDSSWADLADLDAPVVALASTGPGLLALTAEGEALAVDAQTGRVCAQAQLPEAVGPPYVALGGALYVSPRDTQALVRVGLVDGAACPRSLSP